MLPVCRVGGAACKYTRGKGRVVRNVLNYGGGGKEAEAVVGH